MATLNITPPNNQSFNIMAEWDDTIAAVKRKIEQRDSQLYPRERLRLYHEGTELQNNRSLASYNFPAGRNIPLRLEISND